MTAIAITAPRPQVSQGTSRSIGRIAVVAAIVISLFSLSATPSAEVVPQPISAAVSAIVPDFVEDLFGTSSADAWNWRKTLSWTFTGAAAGAGAGCAVGAVAGMVVASGPGCAGGAAAGAFGGAVSGFFASF